MSDVAREVWDRIIVSMPPQLYTSADENILVAYCEAVALHRKAVNAVKSEGEISVSEKTGAVYQNPWIQIMNKQAGLIAQLGGKLGLDPSARNSLVVPSPSTPSSKFEGLVSIAGGRKE
jgi:P27 family predicted phage terminase small subunit